MLKDTIIIIALLLSTLTIIFNLFLLRNISDLYFKYKHLNWKVEAYHAN